MEAGPPPAGNDRVRTTSGVGHDGEIVEPAGGIDTGLEVTRRRELWKPLLARTPWRDLGVFQFVMRGRKPVEEPARASSFVSGAVQFAR